MKIFFCVMLLLIVSDGLTKHSYTSKLADNWNDQVEQLMLQSMIDKKPRKLHEKRHKKHRTRKLNDDESEGYAYTDEDQHELDHSESESEENEIGDMDEEGLNNHIDSLKQEYHDLIRHHQKKNHMSLRHGGTVDEDLDTGLMEDDASAEVMIGLRNRIKELETLRDKMFINPVKHSEDNWFVRGVKKTAEAIGIHNTSDAAIAGLGTAAFLSGSVAGKDRYKNLRQMALGMQKRSVFSEMRLALFVRQNQKLKAITESCQQTNTRISAVENQIVNDMTRQIDWNTSYK